MKKFIAILLLIVAVGCAKKYTAPVDKAVTPEKPAIKEEVVKPEKAEQVKEQIVEEQVVEEKFVPEKGKLTETARPADKQAESEFRDVLFDYDKYDIRPDARPVLDTAAAILKTNEPVNIVIEGHCDERGTNEYNLALGEKRAKAAKNYLVSLGISPARIIVITFGEEKPVCTEQNETCWQNNRRAHFVNVTSRFQ
ncbi:MAG: peptidoglycan-associated lipoprotein Pal [Nitrospirae bacterium]|nr:peptidoglycan-associated lipoprotein Pal [Nitrospirota bacterium]